MEFLVFYINFRKLSATNKRSQAQILQCSWQPAVYLVSEYPPGGPGSHPTHCLVSF